MEKTKLIYEWVEKFLFWWNNFLIDNPVKLIAFLFSIIIYFAFQKLKKILLEYIKHPIFIFTNILMLIICLLIGNLFEYMGLTYNTTSGLYMLLLSSVVFGSLISEILFILYEEYTKENYELSKNKTIIVSIYWKPIIKIFMLTMGSEILSIWFEVKLIILLLPLFNIILGILTSFCFNIAYNKIKKIKLNT